MKKIFYKRKSQEKRARERDIHGEREDDEGC